MDTSPTPAAAACPRTPVPLASRGPLSRETFTQWLDQATAVAIPGSAPVLLLIVLDGIDEAANDTLVEAAALQLCETLGDDGLVCRLGMARLGVLLASDGPSPPEATAGTLLTALVGPLPGAARLPRTPRLALSRWNPDTSTAAALYTAAANALHAAEVAAMERALASAARIA